MVIISIIICCCSCIEVLYSLKLFGGAYTRRGLIIDDSFKQTFSVDDLSHSCSTRL